MRVPVTLGFLLLADTGHVDRDNGSAKCLLIIAAIEKFVGDVGERHLLGIHQIALADRLGRDAEIAR